MEEQFTILKDQIFSHYNITMYQQMFLKHLIWILLLEKKLRILVKKIFFHDSFLHVQNFMDKLLLNLVFRNLVFCTNTTLKQDCCKIKCTSIIN
jgi:hypothetical protein